MEEKDLISVIVPVYNSEMFLHQCIQSVIEQTYEYWELLLINDASQDNSKSVCEQYIKQDNRIKLIDLPQNGGVSNARNEGIRNAKGKYIIFVDSDDFISNDYIQSLYEAVEKNKIVRTTKDNLSNKMKPEEYVLEVAYGNTLGSSCGYLIEKEKISNLSFDTSVSYMEDTIFIMQCIMQFEEVISIQQGEYHYICNPQSLTQSNGKAKQRIEKYLESIERIEYFLQENNIAYEKVKMANRRVNMIKNEIANSSREEIKKILRDENITFWLKNKNCSILKNKIFVDICHLRPLSLVAYLFQLIIKFKSS